MKTLKEYFIEIFSTNLHLNSSEVFEKALQQIRKDYPNAIEFTEFIDKESSKK
ncbi:hypothetical protein H8D36_03360 [archaeon]|nr:hypothetical protein [archaeon]